MGPIVPKSNPWPNPNPKPKPNPNPWPNRTQALGATRALNAEMLSANAHIKTGHAFGSGWAGWPLGSTPVFYWQEALTLTLTLALGLALTLTLTLTRYDPVSGEVDPLNSGMSPSLFFTSTGEVACCYPLTLTLTLTRIPF